MLFSDSSWIVNTWYTSYDKSKWMFGCCESNGETRPLIRGERRIWKSDDIFFSVIFGLTCSRHSGGFSNSAPLGQVYLCRPGIVLLFRSQLSHFRIAILDRRIWRWPFLLFRSQLNHLLTSLSWTEEFHDLILILPYNFFILHSLPPHGMCRP